MTEGFDIDCFNDEQRPTESCWDCLEHGEYLMEHGMIDNSDELYEAWRDAQWEKEQEQNEFYFLED